MDIISKFIGVTTPASELQSQISQIGWQVTKLKWDNKLDAFVAEAKNVHGENLSQSGPNDQTAIGNLLLSISRHTRMRTPNPVTSSWKSNFIDSLESIADAYAKAPIYDPKAAIAYKEIGDDSVNRIKSIQDHIHIEPTNNPVPYEHARAMLEDIYNKNHLYVSLADIDHPLWDHNQAFAFRAVHDALGHGVAKSGFDWEGVNKAVAAHMPLLSPNAQQALFTEAIAQPAYAIHYKALGPQKVAIIPDHFEPTQSQENTPTHRGIHPSQHIIPFVKSRTGSYAADINENWSSGIAPIQIGIDGVGNAYLDHNDPINIYDKMNDQGASTRWHDIKLGDGSADYPRMNQAVVNALRASVIGDRKDFDAHSRHYRDISAIPYHVDDPKVFADRIEENRHDTFAIGLRPYTHIIKPFEALIAQLKPNHGFAQTKNIVSNILFQWKLEEQEKIVMQEASTGKRITAGEIEAIADRAIARRMSVFMKNKSNDQIDIPAQTTRAKNESAEILYPPFLLTDTKPLAALGKHAKKLLDAALKDVHEGAGKGHKFRSAVLSLNIPKLTPFAISTAWSLLQPETSEIASIDKHTAELIGHKKEITPREYFSLERQIKAGRDAAGYGHIPLKVFQDALIDAHGRPSITVKHRKALDLFNPKEFSGSDLSIIEAGPLDWWTNTEGSRKQIKEDWDKTIAPFFSEHEYPFGHNEKKIKNASSDAAPNEMHVAISLPDSAVEEISRLASTIGIKNPEDPSDYHITVFYSPEGYDDPAMHEWIRQESISGYRFTNARIDNFPSGDEYAIVLRLDSPEAKKHVERLMDEAEEREIEIHRFPGGWKAHVTIGYQDEPIEEKKKFSGIAFRAGGFYISPPRV